MSNQSNQQDLDKELADMTDNLLAGQMGDVSPDNETYAKLVKQLYQVVATSSTPDAAFRAKLTQRLNQEWNTTFQKQPKRFVLPRYAATAAAIAAILVLVLAIATFNNQTQVTPTPGASVTGNATVAIITAVIGAVVVLGLIIWQRRK